jgi:hypothetical protein
MSRDDTDEIHRRLNDELENILDRYWSGWITDKRKGQDIALLTPRVKEKGRKPSSSFTVHLSGSDRGKWFRFSIGEGGGILALLHYGDTGNLPRGKSDWAEAYKIAKDFLGIEDRREEPEEAAEREKRIAAQREQRERESAQRKAEAAVKAEERTLDAKEAWQGSSPLVGSLGEAYLVARGLPPVSEWPWNPDHVLRFHPALDYELDKRCGLLPAVIGKIQDEFDKSTSIWQIFLKVGRPEKADVVNPKLGRGPASGGAIRIGGIGPHIGAAEGMESALAAWVLWGFRRPVWSMMSTSGMSNFEPPMEIEKMTIFPDSDKAMIQNGKILDPPGITAARKLKARMDAAGVKCTILEINTLGDCLDLLNTRRQYEQKTGSAAAPSKHPRRTDSSRQSARL